MAHGRKTGRDKNGATPTLRGTGHGTTRLKDSGAAPRNGKSAQATLHFLYGESGASKEPLVVVALTEYRSPPTILHHERDDNTLIIRSLNPSLSPSLRLRDVQGFGTDRHQALTADGDEDYRDATPSGTDV